MFKASEGHYEAITHRLSMSHCLIMPFHLKTVNYGKIRHGHVLQMKQSHFRIQIVHEIIINRALLTRAKVDKHS